MKTSYKYFLIGILSFGLFFLDFQSSFAFDLPSWLSSSSSSGGSRPEINCAGLPGCDSGDIAHVSTSSNPAVKLIGRIIGAMVKYTSVLAVVALMVAGVMYLLSGGEEERVKKAKKWIIWSLIGVVVSVSAWFIVNLVNNLSIG